MTAASGTRRPAEGVGCGVVTRVGAVAPATEAGSGAVARTGLVAAAEPSARANSSAEPNRSAATGASARATAASTCSGTLGRAWRTRGTSPLNRFAMIACAVGPVKGGSPASISYSTAPRE